jgi:2-methylisocitrate lyase-like PEP mutase family enzyme
MKSRDLPSLLKSGKMVVAPGAYDAFSARMIAGHGFPAVYLTGYGTTASLMARPDIGFLTLNDMCGVVRNICQAIDIPLIADAESGFGNAVNLVRTVREYEQAGAAAIHLEDQIVPKRNADSPTPQVVPWEEHASKIRLAVKSRRSSDFLIIGRTDCIQGMGLDEAIRRGNAYRKAGADIIFIHGIASRKELVEVGKKVNGPKLVNYSALSLSDEPTPPSVAELHALGYSIVIFAIEPLFAAVKGLSSMIDILKRGGSAEQIRTCMIGKDLVEETLGASSYQALEASYLPPLDRSSAVAGSGSLMPTRGKRAR